MCNRYAQSDEKKNFSYYDANNSYCYNMMENLPHVAFNFVRGFKLDDLSNTPDEK